MRIIIIIDNNDYFLPDYNDTFLKNTKNDVLDVGIVKKIPKTSSLNFFILKNIFNLKFNEVLKLLLSRLKKNILSILNILLFKKSNFTILDVLKKRKISYFYIYKKIDESILLQKIKRKKIDFIISINSLIFSKKILKSPKYCCINRHTSLLPKNKGLLPVFYSLKNNDKEYGVSFHVMEKNIDDGKILVQKKIPIRNNQSLMDLYRKSFLHKENLIDKSIDNYLNNIYIKNNFEHSYNSWPNKVDWKIFRQYKKKFI